MKIVFLDIDGVLNSGEHFKSGLDQSLRMQDKAWWMEMLDPAAIALLNGLLDRTGAKVVVSSTWRHAQEVDEIQECLEGKGFTGKLIGATPRRGYETRGEEIQAWIDSTHHDVEAFVILDDDSDMGELMGRLVHTTWEKGLLPEHIEPAEALLELLV